MGNIQKKSHTTEKRPWRAGNKVAKVQVQIFLPQVRDGETTIKIEFAPLRRGAFGGREGKSAKRPLLLGLSALYRTIGNTIAIAIAIAAGFIARSLFPLG